MDAKQQQLIARLDEEGLSAPEIAKAAKCHPRTVQRWRERENRSQPYRQAHPPEVRARAAQMVADRVPFREIARTLGIRDTTVGRWFPEAPRMSPQESGAYARLHRGFPLRITTTLKGTS